MTFSGKFWKKIRDMLYVSVGGAAFFAGISVYKNDCKFYKQVTLPLLCCVDPEMSHHLTLWALKHRIVPARRDKPPAELHVRCLGFELDSPIGLAAGLDKDGEAVEGLSKLGFGLVEVGSVTPRPQAGNPQPRVFRLVEDEAIINRYGFNSAGHATVQSNLSALPPPGLRLVPVGVNLGINKGSVDSTEDYRKGVRELGHLADYLVINVSSPNTPGLRGLQEGGALSELLDGVLQERNKLAGKSTPPLLVKLAPDLSDEEIRNICKVLLNKKVDGVIVSNTTLRRPSTLRSEHRGEVGGLSGLPLEDHATRVVALVADCTGGALPIVGCGGVRDGAGVYRKLRAGASLVQLYTGLVYAGPGLVKEAEQDLLTLLRKDGHSSVSEVIGKDTKDILSNS